jgi:hypothetical protein
MAVGLAAVAAQLVAGSAPPWISIASLALVAPATTLAALRVVPNAARLGRRCDPAEVQSALARQICRDHLLCLAAIGGFIAVQLLA